MRLPSQPFLQSKLGRRLLGLFLLCAIAPLLLATLFLTREFNAQLKDNETRELDLAIRGFGMMVLGRLGEADDVIDALANAPGVDDRAVRDGAARLPWVHSSQIIAPAAAGSKGLPLPDDRQRSLMARDSATILWNSVAGAKPTVYLLRPLRGGSWLYAELSQAWLWADAAEYSHDALIRVSEDTHTAQEMFNTASSVTKAQRGSALATRRSWSMFLGARFGAPSWRVTIERPAPRGIALFSSSRAAFPALLGGTLLVIMLLSIRMIRRQLRPLERLTRATQRIAQRDFNEQLDSSGDDEFADLARSFNGMADSLKLQFSALESVAEIDRLLLRTPDLEQILDTLLPQMSKILGCNTAAVVLVDSDARENARAYEYFVEGAPRLPVRRVVIDQDLLSRASLQPAHLELTATAGSPSFLAPHVLAGAEQFRIFSLRHDSKFSGFLCLGFTNAGDSGAIVGLNAHDFADRLSMILANLERLEQLYLQAHYDTLTHLPNRRLFADRVNIAIAQAKEAQAQGALLYIDLDHFKRVNDTAGHPAGDELLRIVAERIAACVKEGDSLSRLSGDEFAVLLPQIKDAEAAGQVAERILAVLRDPVVIGTRQHHIGASIGIALLPHDGESIDALLKASDIAMYRAKEAGRGRAMFFESDMQERMQLRLSMETGLHRALAQQEFQVVYQPIVGSGGRDSLGAEALVRWPVGPDGTMRGPAEFIPVAEECGLIVTLGSWILRTACRQFLQWRKNGLALDYISVNVSARQIHESEFLQDVLSALRIGEMQPDNLQLEITESVLAEGPAMEFTLRQLAGMGVRIALDDFGTGYSSLSYLRVLPIHTVKIDRSFVSGIPEDVASCRLAESIIAMSAVLGKQVVAEGVETEAQLQFLERAGCNAIQGYYLGRPMLAEDLPGFARRLRSRADLHLAPQLIERLPQAAG
jgi:diguanylate cyclase